MAKEEQTKAKVTSKLERFGLFLINPMVAKLDKVDEKGDPATTQGGIVKKAVFLLALTIVGVVLYFLTKDLIPTTYMTTVEGYTINMIEVGIIVGLLILGVLAPIISFKFVGASSVLGSLYSLIQGYVLAFLFQFFGKDYLYPCFIALGMTIFIVLAMLFLYRLHWIKIEKKFTSMLITIIVVGLLLSLMTVILDCIPATKEYVDFLYQNKVVVLLVGSIGIAIASLFLLVDFEVINHCVESQLPKKYEWLAAFALSFSVIEIYVKVLNFILKITQKNED